MWCIGSVSIRLATMQQEGDFGLDKGLKVFSEL